MAKQKFTKGVTPTGEALFAHVLKTEVFKSNGTEQDTGKFTIMVKLSKEAQKKLLKQIDDEWEAFKETLGGKKLKYDYATGLKEYKDEEYFKFGMKEHFTLKSGETIHRTVPIFDCDNREISKSLTGIGNGSKVRVAYELAPFFMSDKNYGVSLRLSAIQIIDLVEYGGNSAAGFGFEEAEGYKQEDADLPFTSSEDENEEAVAPEDDF